MIFEEFTGKDLGFNNMYIVTPPECNNKLNMYLDSQLFLSFSKFLKHVFNIALKLQKLNNHS